MRLVLDSGALSALATQRARLDELQRRGLWPPQVPCVVLTEALTGDHRRDFHANRLLRTCQVRAVDESHARYAARLRTATGRAGRISVADAIVVAVAVAVADAGAGSVVFTSDPGDLRALAEHAAHPITIVSV